MRLRTEQTNPLSLPGTESSLSGLVLCSDLRAETDDVWSEIAKIQNLSPLIAMKNWKNTIKRGWIQHKLYQGKILRCQWEVVGGPRTEYSQVNFRMIEGKDVDD